MASPPLKILERHILYHISKGFILTGVKQVFQGIIERVRSGDSFFSSRPYNEE